MDIVTQDLKKINEILTPLIHGGLIRGFNNAQIANGIQRAKQFYAQPVHRCCACLRWNCQSGVHTFAVIYRGVYTFSACCEDCRQKIDQKTDTETMRKNMSSYLGGAK